MDDDRDYYDFEYNFCEICWWCGWKMLPIRKGIIDICNKYAGTGYTEESFDIYFPQTALGEIYGFLVRNSYIGGKLPFETYPGDMEWLERLSYEASNLTNAEKLHRLIYMLELLKYEKDASFCGIITFKNDKDKERFMKAPREYEWEFLFVNSY